MTARKCPREKLDLVTRQLNHDAQTSNKYYECVRADNDATSMFKTIAGLRKQDTAKSIGEDMGEDSGEEEDDIFGSLKV